MEKFTPPVARAQEKGPERIFTKEEILEVIGQFIEGYTIERELSDAEGVYLLEARVASEKPGEITEYRYQRKGNFGRNQSSQTAIHIAYYDESGMPTGGTTVANYDENTGKWEPVK